MLQKSILTLLVLLCYNMTFAQASIDVNPVGNPFTNLTAGELIRDVLIANNNITFDPTTVIVNEDPDGVGNPELRSWGYFIKGQTNFPFDDGIILSTGRAVDAEGPNNDNGFGNSGFGWAGDADIETILNNTNGDNIATNNATIFQFDFVPEGTKLTFDFIFASEEYENDFECDLTFRDGFAFLIKGPGIPDNSGTAFGGSNIAAIPGSPNIAVNTGSIHADFFNCGGEVLGTNFFPELYISNSGANNTNEVQFDGYTTILNTETTVVPGETYTIKFVITDRGDTSLDSAVFIRGFTVNSNVIIVDEQDSELDFSICEGDTEILTAKSVDDPFSGSETYEWQLDGVTITGETTSTITVSQSGTYTVIVTDLGRTFEDTITVTVITPPNAGEDGSVMICSGDTAIDLFTILGGNPDTGGNWSPALQSGTGIFDPALDTEGIYTYTVLGTGAALCPDDSSTVNVEVDTTPTLTLNDASCDSDQLTYSVTFSTNGTWDITTDPPNIGTIDVNNSMITGITSGTNLVIIAINPDNTTCETTLGITAPVCNCPDIEEPSNPSNITICECDTNPILSVDLIAGQSANWYAEDGTALITNSTTYTPIEVAIGNYTYLVESIDVVSGCPSDRIEVLFSIVETTIIELESEDIICIDPNGNPIDNGDFPIINTFLSDADYSFVWSFNGTPIIGETSSSITVTEPGEYTVMYTNLVTNCSETSSVIIASVMGPEDLDLSLSLGAFAENNDIIATVTGDGVFQYILDNGSPQESNIFQNVALGLHEVTVIDSNGCGSISKEIFVVGFPNFFTPNNDGFNDTWNVIADFELPEMKIYIFDRYGKLLTELDPNGPGWDGVYNGTNLPATDYWFSAEFQDGSGIYKSHFSLRR